MCSRLDYCNSILSGIAETDLTKLQRVLNCLACVVTKSPPLLTVFHCCAPFIGYQWNVESISRSACWPTRLFTRNNLFTFAPWLALLLYHAHWDQAEESLCQSLGSRPTLAQEHSALAPLFFGTTFHYLSAQQPSEEISKHTLSTWSSPHRHQCA